MEFLNIILVYSILIFLGEFYRLLLRQKCGVCLLAALPLCGSSASLLMMLIYIALPNLLAMEWVMYALNSLPYISILFDLEIVEFLGWIVGDNFLAVTIIYSYIYLGLPCYFVVVLYRFVMDVMEEYYREELKLELRKKRMVEEDKILARSRMKRL